MSDVDKGRALWAEQHPERAARNKAIQHEKNETQDTPSEGTAAGASAWRRRRAGGTFALGPEPLAPDVTPGGDAA